METTSPVSLELAGRFIITSATWEAHGHIVSDLGNYSMAIFGVISVQRFLRKVSETLLMKASLRFPCLRDCM